MRHQHRFTGQAPRKLCLECLEDRTVPSILTWIGDVTGNSTFSANVAGNTNWSGDLLPSNGDTLVFDTSVPHFSGTPSNDYASLSLHRIEINFPAGMGNMTFSGNGFSLGSGGIEANLDGAVAGLGMTINLTADQTFTSNGAQWLMLKGNVALNSHTLTLTTNGTATNILMSDSGQFTGNGTIIKNGSASLEMRTDSTFNGQFIVDAGNANVMSGDALGAIGAGNETIVNGGLLRFNTVTTMTVPESITLNGGNISVVYNSGHVQFSGVVNLAAHASISNSSGVSMEFQNSINTSGFQLTVNVPSTLESITINGSINGAGKVIKIGVGNLIMGGSAASLYSGGTDILDGTITLQKTSGTSALGLGLITVGQTSTGSAKLIVNGHENISFFASCLVNLTGELSLPSSTTEVINNLTLNRGIVSVVGSTLSVFNFNVIGTTGNDSIVLSGTEAALTLSGAGTAAGILVRNAVAIDANVGNDTINAIAYSSLTKRTSLTGGDGNDTIFGSSAIDYIFAGLGNDNIDAGSGDDTVYGNEGNDTVVGGLGNDVIDFGTGSDLGLSTFDSDHFVSSTAFQALNVSSTDTISNMEIAAIYTGASNNFINLSLFNGIGIADGGAGNDTIAGSNQTDYIYGSAGIDVINGQAGDDYISGGDDGDNITGWIGNDTIDGGLGNETVAAGDGNDLILGGDGNDNLDLGNGNDTVDAGAGTDRIVCGTGDDSVLGGSGNDTLQGDDGNDMLFGNDNDDLILGNNGDDTLDGGNGIDSAGGGAGINTIINVP